MNTICRIDNEREIFLSLKSLTNSIKFPQYLLGFFSQSVVDVTG